MASLLRYGMPSPVTPMRRFNAITTMRDDHSRLYKAQNAAQKRVHRPDERNMAHPRNTLESDRTMTMMAKNKKQEKQRLQKGVYNGIEHLVGNGGAHRIGGAREGAAELFGQAFHPPKKVVTKLLSSLGTDSSTAPMEAVTSAEAAEFFAARRSPTGQAFAG